jgi:hypothetical protein
MKTRSTTLANRSRWGKIAGITVAVLAATTGLALPSASAATRVTVYDNVPAPLPGNVPSIGFEATSTSEFGGIVQLGGTARRSPAVTFVMSTWACQRGTVGGGDCSTTRGAVFTHPLTVNVYRVGADNEPGALIGTVTHTFKLPYRPSANYSKCFGDNAGKWFSRADQTCYNGKDFTRKVALGSLDLPDSVIVSIAYNTTHYGSSPMGEATTCFGTTAGCAYDSLNVGTSDVAPRAGAQPQPDDAYQDSSWTGAYCDNGAAGTGTFRLDAGCWTGYQPAFKVTAL